MNFELPFEILDGKDTVGGTKILLHEKGRGLLLDFGLNYNRFGRFFEEYMKPRVTAGVFDLWQLGLLPPYPSLYRSELMLHELLNAQKLPVDQIDGVLLSHAHMDHAGLIGTLDLNIPIISSATTLAILRAYQDSGRTQFYQEPAYGSPFEACDCRTHKIIRTGHYKTCSHKGRKAIVAEGDLSKGLRDLWRRQANPDGSGRGMDCGDITTIADSSIDWDVKMFPVDHSIFGACANVIESKNGAIAYTGDLRFCGSRSSATERFIKEAKKLGTDILITEGTQVTRKNQCKTTEKECEANCKEVIAKAERKLVIADFSPRNVERLITFLEIANETDRRLVILPKDAYLLNCLQKVEEKIPVPSDSLLVYDTPKGKEANWEKWIYDIYKNYLTSAPDISKSPGKYILAFSFFDMKFLNDIEPDGGLYVYSSSEPHTEEERIDFQRLNNWLSFYNIDVKGFRCEKLEDGDNFELEMESGYHCSGHATAEELEKIVLEIDPDILVPVHTENPEWFKEKFGKSCKVII